MHKMYVLVRRDLSTSQQAVQAGHAVAELVQRGLSTDWNGTLIYLGVESEEMLNRWKSKLAIREIRHVEFREPDIGDQMTAIASVCDGKAFSKLKLL